MSENNMTSTMCSRTSVTDSNIMKQSQECGSVSHQHITTDSCWGNVAINCWCKVWTDLYYTINILVVCISDYSLLAKYILQS